MFPRITLNDGPQTLSRGPRRSTVSEVRLAFLGELRIGRVGAPARPENGIAVASPLDLLATKLKALHDRIEAKDYLDIEALLRSGLDLTAGSWPRAPCSATGSTPWTPRRPWLGSRMAV